MSILAVAKRYIKNKSKNQERYITNVELIEHVVKKTGRSKESVRGNIFGSSLHRLYNLEVQKELKIEPQRRINKKPARFRLNVKRRKNQAFYDDSNKQKVRDLIVSKVENKVNPAIVTFAAETGYCVQHFLKAFKNPLITNIEKHESVLLAYNKLKLPTTNYLGTFTEFYNENHAQHDLLFYDSVGGLCSYMLEDFKALNRRKDVKIIAITLLGIKRMRYGGILPRFYNKKYAGKDVTLEVLKNVIFTNYDIIENTKYKKENVQNSRGMRVIILRLKS